MLSRFILSALAVATLAAAQLPTSKVNCGGNKYTPAYITKSINAGVKYLKNGNLQDDYPHEYYSYSDEHITLYCNSSPNGPWYEYPMLPDGDIYTSPPNNYQSPGTDRVIFTESGTYCACVTHTGASSYDGFVACSNDE